MSDDTVTVTKQELKELLGEALDETLTDRRTIDEGTHRVHHAWLNAELERRAQRAATIRKIRENVIGWGIIALLSGIGTLIYRGWSSMQKGLGGE